MSEGGCLQGGWVCVNVELSLVGKVGPSFILRQAMKK